MNLLLVICIAKNFIWTTWKTIFSLYIYCTLRLQIFNSYISVKYCHILKKHTSMESLWCCINLNLKKLTRLVLLSRVTFYIYLDFGNSCTLEILEWKESYYNTLRPQVKCLEWDELWRKLLFKIENLIKMHVNKEQHGQHQQWEKRSGEDAKTREPWCQRWRTTQNPNGLVWRTESSSKQMMPRWCGYSKTWKQYLTGLLLLALHTSSIFLSVLLGVSSLATRSGIRY